MPIITLNQSSKWHQDIEATAAKYTPVDSAFALNSGRVSILYFPFVELQAHTGVYLKKKLSSRKPEDRHRRLIALVKEHRRKDVALAACAHALSGQSVRELLYSEFRG